MDIQYTALGITAFSCQSIPLSNDTYSLLKAIATFAFHKPITSKKIRALRVKQQ